MRLPAFLFCHKAKAKPYIGSSAYGPVYGNTFQTKCRIESYRKMVRDREGVEVVAEARAFFPPEVDLPPESIVTWEGRDYTVIEARKQYGLRTPSHLEVVLR